MQEISESKPLLRDWLVSQSMANLHLGCLGLSQQTKFSKAEPDILRLYHEIVYSNSLESASSIYINGLTKESFWEGNKSHAFNLPDSLGALLEI